MTSKQFIKMETPSWRFAVTIYIAVLENPDAPESTKESVRKELLRLATFADQAKADAP